LTRDGGGLLGPGETADGGGTSKLEVAFDFDEVRDSEFDARCVDGLTPMPSASRNKREAPIAVGAGSVEEGGRGAENDGAFEADLTFEGIVVG